MDSINAVDGEINRLRAELVAFVVAEAARGLDRDGAERLLGWLADDQVREQIAASPVVDEVAARFADHILVRLGPIATGATVPVQRVTDHSAGPDEAVNAATAPPARQMVVSLPILIALGLLLLVIGASIGWFANGTLASPSPQATPLHRSAP